MGKSAEALQEYHKSLAIHQKLAEANPAVIEFQRGVAWSHSNIGQVLAETGKPIEAMQEYYKMLAIHQKLTEANPAVTELQKGLAWSYNQIGWLHTQERRFADAFAALDRGLAIRQKLAEAHPMITEYTNHLGDSHGSRGRAHVRAGRPAEAADDLRRALVLWEKGKAADRGTRFERARALSLLAGLGKVTKSGVTTAQAAAFADQAVAALRDAFQAGCGKSDELKEPDFDTLRGRDDFKKLLAELEAKAKKEAESK
jgi:tetratricopeptide (TPR) repeat protein